MTKDTILALMESRAKKATFAEWEPQDSVDGNVYCNVCGGGRDKSGEDFFVAVGFGSADVSASRSHIFSERECDDFVTLLDVEGIAQKYPKHDWRISLNGPLSGQEYQRQSDGWKLISADEGFA